MADDTPGSESSPTPDPTLAELTALRLPEAAPETPEPQETQSEPEGGESAAAASAEPAQAAPTAAPEVGPAKEEPRIEIRGRRYTAGELAARPDLLEDLAQTYEQFPALQQKYVEKLEAERRAAERPAPVEVTPLSQQQIRLATANAAKEAVEKGYIESEMAEVYPDTVAQFILHRDLLYDARAAIFELKQRVSELQGHTEKASAESLGAQVKAKIEEVIGSFAESNEFYAGLKDPKHREEFIGYLVREVNPKGKQAFDPKFLARQYVGYRDEAVLEKRKSTKETVQKIKEQEARDRKLAKGDGTSTRPTAGKPDGWDKELATFGV